MIHHLDNLLRHLFITQIDEIADEMQVGFQPPDAEWRAHVGNLQRNALNVYLADLRENRKLRSNEQVRDIQNGFVRLTSAPRRIDCHYLITAWSPAMVVTETVEPALDEHALLYLVTGVLMNNEPLIPQRVYAPDPPPAAFPPTIADAELPTAILPVEGFPQLAEFWGAMGNGNRWKPAIYLVVTLPVLMETQKIDGPVVTTHVIHYRRPVEPDTAKVSIQIAGRVLDATVDPPQPLADAAVQVEGLDDGQSQTVVTRDDGCFTFGQLSNGRYRLRAQTTERGAVTRVVDIDPPANVPGDYDLRFE